MSAMAEPCQGHTLVALEGVLAAGGEVGVEGEREAHAIALATQYGRLEAHADGAESGARLRLQAREAYVGLALVDQDEGRDDAHAEAFAEAEPRQEIDRQAVLDYVVADADRCPVSGSRSRRKTRGSRE